MKVAIDECIAKGDLHRLLLMSLAYVGISFINWLSVGLRTYLMGWVSQTFVNRLRDRLFRHLQDLSLSFYDKARAGDLISRVINDTSAIQEAFISGALSILGDVLTLAGVIAAMLYLSLKLTLVSLAVVPLMVAVGYLFGGPFRHAYMSIRQRVAEIATRVQETVTGARVIQAFAREEDAIKNFEEISLKTLKANLRAAMLSALFFLIIPLISAVGNALVLWYGGMLVLGGEITLGILVAFTSYVGSMFRPIMTLVGFYDTLQSAAAAAERIFEILDAEPEVKDAPDAIDVPRLKGEVVFENVTFEYVPGVPVLKDVNLRIAPGERIAIVGPTGAGKTTLVSLLCRFYEVKKGRILLDGIDIRKIKQASLRRQIGFVPQEAFIFPGTVKDNIRLGRPDASDQEVIEVCKKLGIHEYIESLPQGYDTPVGEQGIGLSTGQKQLIAIARAMIRDPPILILDEAMYGVDPYTEALIRRALERLMRGRTTIIIAHRLVTVTEVDRIIVLDKGRIVEEGTHEELMAKRGLYYRLYTSQLAISARATTSRPRR